MKELRRLISQPMFDIKIERYKEDALIAKKLEASCDPINKILITILDAIVYVMLVLVFLLCPSLFFIFLDLII
jgi:hypothetical protein